MNCWVVAALVVAGQLALLHPAIFATVHSITSAPISTCAPPGSSLVVVTGISSGLGYDLALHLLEEGFTVLGTVRKEQDRQRLQAEAAKISSGNLVCVLCDVRSGPAVAQLVQTASQLLDGGLAFGGLVNNAGVSGKFSLDDWASGATYRDAQRIFEVNVLSVVNVTGSLMPLLLRAGAGCPWPRIVNIGSLAAIATPRAGSIYSSSKASIECISDDLRRMLKPKGVWVSVIEPGFVASGMCTGPQCQSSTAATTTTPAIMHALTDGHPLTRYPVAGAYGIPAWFIVGLSNWLPDHLADAMFLVIEPSEVTPSVVKQEL